MKTVTEFSGFTIKSAAQARAKLTGEGVAPEQLTERLGADLNVSGDRLARLVEALDAVGADAERVRLVRVFAATDEPRGAKKIGEFNYLIDFQPPAGGKPREERGGRHGGRGGGDRGRGGGGGGGGGGPRGGGGGGGDRGGPGGFKPRQPMGLKSLTKAAKLGTAGGPPREEREERGPLPRVGQGWMLTSAPGDPRDKGRGKGRGKPGDRKGRPGKPGERTGKPGERAGGDRPRGDRPGGDRPRGDRPGGDRPGGRPPFKPGDRPARGPRPEGARPPGAPGERPAHAGAPGAPGQPGDAERKKRRRRRGRGGGGPRPPMGAPQAGVTPGPLAGSGPPPPAPPSPAPQTPAPSPPAAPAAAVAEPPKQE